MSGEITSGDQGPGQLAWARWYFSTGPWIVLTALLFLSLLMEFLVVVFGACVQGFALFRVLWAVWGVPGVILLLAVGWWPIVAPPAIYYQMLKSLPEIWSETRDTVVARVALSVVVLGVGIGMSEIVSGFNKYSIGWIADRDPCKAEAAGVIGSEVPENCP